LKKSDVFEEGNISKVAIRSHDIAGKSWPREMNFKRNEWIKHNINLFLWCYFITQMRWQRRGKK
jgi:hypothetical protein